jgi:competence protein ComEA
MHARMHRVQAIVRRAFSALAGWVWAPVLGKGLVWIGAFLALAEVGSGGGQTLLGLRAAAVGTAHAGVLASASAARASPPCPPGSSAPATKAVTANGRVILNLAGVDELRTLRGIGAKRAQAIVELRDKLGGRFKSVRDLARVRGLGARSIARLEPLVVLDPPKE